MNNSVEYSKFQSIFYYYLTEIFPRQWLNRDVEVRQENLK